MKKSTKIEKGVAMLIAGQPFFASILLGMERVEDESIPTMATDGTRLYYNPEFSNKLTIAELEGVLCHEALHPAFLHHTRRNGREPVKWNMACDYAINPVVLDAGLTLPEGALIDRQYSGMSAEKIYDLMPDPPIDLPIGSEGGEGTGGNQKPNSSTGHFDKPCPWGMVNDAENPDGSAKTDAQKKEIEQRWKVKLKQAAATAKRQGKLPAGMQRLIDELMEPKLDWRTILSRWAGELSRCDYSFRFPNQRYAQGGFMLPSLRKETIGKVVFGMDTSGSMGGDQLREIISEVYGAMQEYEKDGVSPELTVLWCDTEVHEQQVSDPSEFNPVGGGGTLFKPVFDHIADHVDNPRAVVYLTDGYCDDFDYTPSCPVLWGLTERNDTFNPPFGEVMVINQ